MSVLCVLFALLYTSLAMKNRRKVKVEEPAAEAAAEPAALWDQPAEFEKALATMDLSGVVADVEPLKKPLVMNTHCTENDSNYLYALAFKQAVETLSGGAMSVEVYANGQLFGQADALQAVQQGTLDIANSDTALLANYDPAAGVLDIPYLMKNREQAVRCVQDDEFAAFINKMIEPSDMHLLSILPLNFRNSLVKNMDIDSFDDFKGFIMRTPEAPHTIAAFEAFGATPTVIPSGEAYTSVQTGVADGLEGHAEYMVLQKFYEVAKNYVQTQHVFTFTDYVMSGKVYNGLTDKQREVIDAAAKQAQGVHIAYTANLYPAMYATLEANGCKITEIDRQPFVDATESYRNAYIEANNLQDLIAKVDSYE
jgi:tripartite ATP-independent transporter DctP family solute receptor